jgi:hypothetical protein
MSDPSRCPNCWSDVPEDADRCPVCGLNPKLKLLQFGLAVVMIGGLGMWLEIPGAVVLVLVGAGLAVTSRIGPTIWA